MKNKEIKLYARGKGVPFWKVARELGISEPTMTRLLRNDLSEEKYEKIKAIIDQIAAKED